MSDTAKLTAIQALLVAYKNDFGQMLARIQVILDTAGP